MGLLSLIARLSLDTSDFRSKLKGSEREAQTSGERMGKQMSSAFGRFFTAGFLLNTARGFARSASEVEDLSKKYEKLGMVLSDSAKGEIKEFGDAYDKAAAKTESAFSRMMAASLRWAQAALGPLKDLYDVGRIGMAGMFGGRGAAVRTARSIAGFEDPSAISNLTPEEQKASDALFEAARKRAAKEAADDGIKPGDKSNVAWMFEDAKKVKGASFKVGGADALASIGGFTAQAGRTDTKYLERIARATEATPKAIERVLG